jgi:hypothetical protein
VKLIISSLQAHPAYQTDTTNYVESWPYLNVSISVA